MNMVRERKLDNVRFLGQQPATRMPHIYALSEVLLAHYKRDPLFEISIPAKIFSYMACQRPVLMASAGDAADLVEAAGAGTICPAEDPQAMAQVGAGSALHERRGTGRHGGCGQAGLSWRTTPGRCWCAATRTC